MNNRVSFRRCAVLCALALTAWVVGAPAAQAEAIPYAVGSSLARGKQSFQTELDFQSAGLLTVNAWDFGSSDVVFEPLESLSFSVTGSGGVLGSLSGTGSLSLDIEINSPGLYMLNLFAKPSAQYGVGVLSWNVFFTPTVTQVPLPAGVWLLIAGAAWATGLQRKRASILRAGIARLLPRDRGLALAH